MRHRHLTRLAVVLAVGIALAGCGQKGNLYLPNQKQKVPATAPAPAQQTPPAATSAATSGASGAH